jgi:hypothetical protein
MELQLVPKQEVWRGRGAPRKQVPDEIKHAADATYKTGKVGNVVIASDEEEEAKELIGLLTSYANSLGKRMRVQRQDDTIRFEMVDRVKRAKKVVA